MPATVSFAGVELNALGTPRFGLTGEYEIGGDGLPQALRTTYAIKVHCTGDSFADNHAVIDRLLAVLRAGEGRLLIHNEDGVPVADAVAKVKGHEVPDDWRQHYAEVSLSLETREALTSAAGAAVFTPTGGRPIPLSNITAWKEAARVERYDPDRSNRRNITVSISAGGTILADKTLPAADRRAGLRELQAALRAATSRDGLLSYGGQERRVKVESLDTDLGDGSERLEWTLEAVYTVFPGDSYLETEYEVSTRRDTDAGELVTAVQGEIRTDSKAKAQQKFDELRALFDAPGRVLATSEFRDSTVAGADGTAWLKGSFSFEYREALDILAWSLRISTRDDAAAADRAIGYEGRVTGKSVAAALDKARALGLGRHPFMTSGSETVSTRQAESGDAQFIEVQFSYEYLAKANWLYAEVSSETSVDPFGESRETVSGRAAAPTLEEAQALGRSFRIAGRLPREQRENQASRHSKPAGADSDPDSLVSQFDFSYTYYLTPAAASASYSAEETLDYTALERSITLSGTAYGPTEAACHALIDALVAESAPAGKLIQNTRSAAYEAQPAREETGNVPDPETSGAFKKGAQFLAVAFSQKYVGAIEAAEGLDIIEAEWSLNITYSENIDSLTLIPYGTAYAQASVGTTIGVKTSTGSVTALSAATAKAWGRAKRGAATDGGHPDPAEERTTYQYPPLDGDNVKAHRFEFTYAARFANLLMT